MEEPGIQYDTSASRAEEAKPARDRVVINTGIRNDELNIKWEKDSSAFSVTCRAGRRPDCLNALDSAISPLGREAATILNESIFSGAGEESDLQLNYRFYESDRHRPLLHEIWMGSNNTWKKFIRGAAGLHSSEDTAGTFCCGDTDCLGRKVFPFPISALPAAVNGKIPVRFSYETWPVPEMRFWNLPEREVRPVARGKVVYISTSGLNDMDVKLYHGSGFFSYYISLGQLRKDLVLGDVLMSEDVLGTTRPDSGQGARPALIIRMEKQGIFKNPAGFFSEFENWS